MDFHLQKRGQSLSATQELKLYLVLDCYVYCLKVYAQCESIYKYLEKEDRGIKFAESTSGNRWLT